MFRRPRPTAVGAAVALALTLSLSACQTNDPAPASESPSASSSSPSPTELPPKGEAIEQAEQVLRDYFRVSDVSLQNPENFSSKDYEKVAISSALVDLHDLYNIYREQGLTQTGGTKIVSIENLTVDLTNKPKLTPPKIPMAEFRVCYDVSGVDTVDNDGKSVDPAGGKARGVASVRVANHKYPGGAWLVDLVEYQEDGTC